jgi:hypothetical protein
MIADSFGIPGCRDMALAARKITASTGQILHGFMRLDPGLPI